MKLAWYLELILLAALWGASFLFMRVAVPEFGPVMVAALRVSIAAVILTLLLAAGSRLTELAADAFPLCVVGVLNAALPFSLFAFATLSLTAGFASILNATAPFFSAVVAFAWLRERLTRLQVAGLVLGFGGVWVLLWGKTAPGSDAAGPAIIACLLATLSYGISANYTRKRLLRASPMAIAAGSQIAAALCLLPLALWRLPAGMPGPEAWLAVVALGVLSTGLAFILYFRLIAHAGATRAMSVTFLIPVFGMLWGMLALDEAVTLSMLAGTAIILVGTALAAGLAAIPTARP